MNSSSRSSSQHRPHQPPAYHGADQPPLSLQAPSTSQPQSRNNSSPPSLKAASSSATDTQLESLHQLSASTSTAPEKKHDHKAFSPSSASSHSSIDHEEHADLPGPLPTTQTLQPLASRLTRADSRPKPTQAAAATGAKDQAAHGRQRSSSISYMDPANRPSDLQRASSRVSSIHRCADPHYPASALALTLTKSEDPYATYIDWPANDPENPFNWPKSRRWLLVSVCFLFTACTAFNGCGYPSASFQAAQDLQTTQLVYLVGNTVFLFAVSITPLVLAPLSEVYGRSPIYLTAVAIFTLLYIPQALAKNITTIIVVRWFQGMAASVGNSMVAGSVSDVFHANERGFPMSLYAIAVYIAQGVSPYISSVTVNKASWRIMFWWQGALSLLTYILMALFLKETRGPVLLSRRAKKLTKETDRLHKCRADDERLNFLVMVKVSLIRPMQYLVCEPVVLSFALWIGFLWGIIFISLEAIPIVFAGYGWDLEQQHLALLTIAVGGTIGYLLNFHQEKLYAAAAHKYGGKPPPEARLYYAAAGAVLAPIGLFIFAWTGRAGINPAAPIIGLTIFNLALFPVYLAVFSYLADVYERYASSALAAQSFLRNTFAAAFPLFSQQMYTKLKPKYASTLLACIAALLGVVPFVLLKYGDRIRKHSRAAMALEAEEREAAEFLAHEEEKEVRRDARRQARAARQAAAASHSTDTTAANTPEWQKDVPSHFDEEKIIDRHQEEEGEDHDDSVEEEKRAAHHQHQHSDDGDTISSGSVTPFPTTANVAVRPEDCSDCNNIKRMPPTSIL
ncbi:related to TPO1-Vacuolar polyamine-H+ antiporter [Ustilago bromivora]|uniref:Related to TPO1 - Vacuolar polyamine-H+ antiporter n=1 Tax=Ustilago bromivora TaxID=307758 RepID=A0A1K0H3B5_9BASI|nr:related to TPO1-Vacuolar polyamine-H+ antiporter [Ustilago bromivora]SYW83722.1 related to TPO1 - Vacuolar polyamine-H+ antiporter [Ustilago bromivora]